MKTETLSEMLDKDNLVRGYVYPYDGGVQEYLFENTPFNIANFIMLYPEAKEIILTDVLDRKILNTIGYFIDRCSDQKLLPQILEHLIPLQTCEKEPQGIHAATLEEADAFYTECNEMKMHM
jgi:hypothetical protein